MPRGCLGYAQGFTSGVPELVDIRCDSLVVFARRSFPSHREAGLAEVVMEIEQRRDLVCLAEKDILGWPEPSQFGQRAGRPSTWHGDQRQGTSARVGSIAFRKTNCSILESPRLPCLCMRTGWPPLVCHPLGRLISAALGSHHTTRLTGRWGLVGGQLQNTVRFRRHRTALQLERRTSPSG